MPFLWGSRNSTLHYLKEKRRKRNPQQEGNELVLHNVLYVPGLQANLLSVPQLVRHGAADRECGSPFPVMILD